MKHVFGLPEVASWDERKVVFWFAEEGLAWQGMGVAEKNNAVSWILALRAVPNAPNTAVVGWEGEELKVKVQAVPEDGKANKELLRFLAKTAGIPRAAITLQSGETSRHKRLLITGVDEAAFLKRLGVAVQAKHGN